MFSSSAKGNNDLRTDEFLVLQGKGSGQQQFKDLSDPRFFAGGDGYVWPDMFRSLIVSPFHFLHKSTLPVGTLHLLKLQERNFLHSAPEISWWDGK